MILVLISLLALDFGYTTIYKQSKTEKVDYV
jgi:hypothetical protein